MLVPSRHTFLALALFTIGLQGSVLGQVETISHAFAGATTDGGNPRGALILANDGNYYGMTTAGGTSYKGTIFKMTPSGTVTVLHNFSDGSVANDGAYPYGALVQGIDGSFYGTTFDGGSAGEGCVFMVTSSGTVKILHSFGVTMGDGIYPYSTLVQTSNGLLYGTTYNGGSIGDGIVFNITTSGTLNILHNFGDGSATNDGLEPREGVILGSDGNFYGTTSSGGQYGSPGDGTVYMMTPGGIVSTIYSFGGSGTDGQAPFAALIEDSSNNLYGTTTAGGANGHGTAFVIGMNGTGYNILHNFGSITNDGESPMSNLLLASDGNLYGTTSEGGSYGNGQSPNYGTVFQLSPNGSSYAVAHDFGSISNDGAYPNAGLIEGPLGLFGMATEGGSGSGTVYKINYNIAQTLTFTLSNMPFTMNPVTLNGTDTTNAFPVTYTKSGPAIISGNVMTLTGGGSLSVRARQAGTAFYAPETVLQNVTISPGPQTINFPAIANQTYPCPPIALDVTTSSGLPVTYTHTGPVTISGNTATITGKGGVGIRAHQDGNVNYAAAPSVIRDFTVN